MLGARTGSPAPMTTTRSKASMSGPSGASASGPSKASAPASGPPGASGPSGASASSASLSAAETQRRPVAPARMNTSAPVAAAGGGAPRPGPSGPALSVAAQRAMRALEALDEAEDDAAPEAAAPEAATPVTKATVVATPVAPPRAEAPPVSGASTWPKEQVQSARPEPPAAARIGERVTSPRQRTYLVGLAASLLLLLIGRSILQADGPWRGESEPAHGSIDESAAESAGSPAATTTGTSPGDPSSGLVAKHTGGAVDPTPPPLVDGSDSAPPIMDAPRASSTGGPEGDETGTGPEVARPSSEPPRAPSAATLIDEGCREVRLGDARRGVDQLMAAHDRAPRSLHLRWCLADGYAKLGKYESALRFYNDLLTETPRHAKALRGAAQANEYLNRRAAAAELYQRLLKIEPGNASARAFLAGEAERERDEAERAAKSESAP
jgi:hypothetical protein